MIYSKKLKDFIKVNTPQAKKYSIPEMVEGLSRKEEKDRVIFTRWESGTSYFSVFFPKGKEMKVEWCLKLEIQKDPKKIFFEPKVYEKGSESRGCMVDPTEAILKQLGLEKVEVELPEPMVQFPIPPWVGDDYTGMGDWPNSEVASKVCFTGEAREMIAEFEKELGKAKEELR